MRRFRAGAAALALIILLLTIAGCGVKNPEEEADAKMKIVTTIFPQYDFARRISGGGELAHVTMLLKPGEEIHSYEPTPLDIRKIRECDLFIYTGGENDDWVERILENMGEEKPQTLRLVDLTRTVEEEHVEGMMEERGEHAHEHSAEEADHDEHEHEHDAEEADHDEHEHDVEEAGGDEHDSDHVNGGDSSEAEHGEADEHVWTSPVKAAEITRAIAEKMTEIDPANAESYRENAEAYVKEIMDLDSQYREIVENAERRTIVFGDRFPIRYFADEYGLEYFAAFAGCSSDSEPSASTLAFLIDKVREEEIPVVFTIEFSNGNIARAICESTGAVSRTFNTCHNVTKEQMENGETYVSLMKKNLDPVREALGQKADSIQ